MGARPTLRRDRHYIETLTEFYPFQFLHPPRPAAWDDGVQSLIERTRAAVLETCQWQPLLEEEVHRWTAGDYAGDEERQDAAEALSQRYLNALYLLQDRLAEVLDGTGVHLVQPDDPELGSDSDQHGLLICVWRGCDEMTGPPFIEQPTARYGSNQNGRITYLAPSLVIEQVIEDLAEVLRRVHAEESDLR